MALTDEAVILAATGYIYLADPDTAKPESITDPLDPGEEWENVGHTSLEEMPEFGREGDDPETIGTWQANNLRQTAPGVSYGLTFQSVQASKETYQLYFGAGPEAVQPDGSFRIPARPTPQIKSLLVVLVDGTNFVPLWHPRASLLGSDAITTSNEYFMSFPITATFLSSSLIGNAIGEWAEALGAGASS